MEYVKGLGETYLTIKRCLVLLPYLLLLLSSTAAAINIESFDQNQHTGQEESFKIVDFFNAKKFERRENIFSLNGLVVYFLFLIFALPVHYLRTSSSLSPSPS